MIFLFPSHPLSFWRNNKPLSLPFCRSFLILCGSIVINFFFALFTDGKRRVRRSNLQPLQGGNSWLHDLSDGPCRGGELRENTGSAGWLATRRTGSEKGPAITPPSPTSPRTMSPPSLTPSGAMPPALPLEDAGSQVRLPPVSGVQ